MATQAEISLNPTSAKGDILTTDGSSRIRTPVGTSAQILVARSSTSTGLSWETPPSSSAKYELIASGVVTTEVQKVDITIPSGMGTTYKHVMVIATAYKSVDNETANAGFILINNTTSGTAQAFVKTVYSSGSNNDDWNNTGSYFGNTESGYLEADALTFIELEFFLEGPKIKLLHTAFNGLVSASGDVKQHLVNERYLTSAGFTTISLWSNRATPPGILAGTKIYVYGMRAYGA
jgi:hypothetical protein